MDEKVRRSPHPVQGDAGTGYDLSTYQAAFRIRTALAKAVLDYRAEHPGAGTVTASVSPTEAQVLREARFTLGELNGYLAGVGGELVEVRVPDESRFAVVASGFPEAPVMVEPEPPVEFTAPSVTTR